MAGDSMTTTYEVHAVKYAHLSRKSAASFLDGDVHDVDMPLDYFVWVVRNADRTILVDTGFDQAMADQRGRLITHTVGDGLLALDVDPLAVRDVVITHLHYDHAGNSALFPNAHFHLQEAEMAFATGSCMCHAGMRRPFEVEDVVAMVRRVYQERVHFCQGAQEIAPGVEVHHIGGHTAGLQVVRVMTAAGWLVLASDASHFYANMEQGRAYPVLYNHHDMLRGYDTLRALAASPQHVIPGHDPLVLQRYPASLPDSAGWIVRLDQGRR